MGSRAQLFNQTGQSINNRKSTIRQTMKLVQVKPPISDEEHYSIDSKEDKDVMVQKIGIADKDSNERNGPMNQLLEKPLDEDDMPEQRSSR